MDVKKFLEEKNVDVLRFTYVGLDGIIRSKGAHVSVVNDMIRTGIGLSKAMLSYTPMDRISPYGSFGPEDEDVFLVPDVGTLSVFPPSAVVLCDLYYGNSPWEIDPRSSLKRSLKRAREELGLEFRSSFELEFYLIKDRKPLDSGVCFDSSSFYDNQVIEEIVNLSRDVGIQPLRIMKEYGPGQFEIDILHKEALRSADEVVLFKEVARQVARRHGVEANFMPKPFNRLAGSGLHLNLSAWRGGRNAFYNPNDRYGMSELAYGFIAGIMEHAKALTALVAPTVNSYKRLVPGSWAPTKIAYGYNNKSAMLRIPTPYPGVEGEDRRVEFRVPDPSSNPYLAILATIEAGLDGVERGLKPQPPVDENVYARGDVPDVPRNLREALTELKRDTKLMDRVGRKLVEEFIKVKTAEVEEYESLVTDWEYEVYSRV